MPDTGLPEQAEEITGKARIHQLLERAFNDGHELQVELEGSEETWRTTISQLNLEEGTILYGQLTPSTWQNAPGLQQNARISCPVKANRIAYSAPLTPAVEDEGLCYLQSPVPEQLFYHQMRAQYRVSLTGRQTAIQVISESGTSMVGHLINISAGGCRCLLQGTLEEFGDTRQLPDGQASIADLLELEFQARICNMQDSPEGLYASLEFLLLAPAQERALQRCMVQLERSTMRTPVAASRG